MEYRISKATWHNGTIDAIRGIRAFRPQWHDEGEDVVILNLPDDVDRSAVEAVVNAAQPIPPPAPDTELEQLEATLAADEATLTAADKTAAVWTAVRRAHSRGRLRALVG